MNDEDFARTWSAHQSAVASVCWAMIGDPHGVDDLVQEVAVVAFRSREKLAREDAFLPWALAIARNKAVDWLRKRGREATVSMDGDSLDLLAAAAQDLAPSLGHRERALEHCLSSLERRQRSLLDRHYQSRQTLVDIAADIGVKVGALKVRIHRLRQRLRQCIEQRLHEWDVQ